MNQNILIKINEQPPKTALYNGIVLMVAADYHLTQPSILFLNENGQMVSCDEIIQKIGNCSFIITLNIMFETQHLCDWHPNSVVKLEFPGFYELSQLEWEIKNIDFDNEDNPDMIGIDMTTILEFYI
jgi:hypothetical protein